MSTRTLHPYPAPSTAVEATMGVYRCGLPGTNHSPRDERSIRPQSAACFALVGKDWIGPGS